MNRVALDPPRVSCYPPSDYTRVCVDPPSRTEVKAFLSKIIGNPAVRKAFLAFVLAVLGAAGYSFTQGCTPAQLQKVDDARAELECVDAALRQYDVLTHPEHVTVEDAAALAVALKACRAADVPAAPDGGAQ